MIPSHEATEEFLDTVVENLSQDDNVEKSKGMAHLDLQIPIRSMVNVPS